MHVTPHALFRRIMPPARNDEYGRPIVQENYDSWEYIGQCRCDEVASRNMKITTTNGEILSPNFHIVCEGQSIKPGDVIRCVGRNDEIICEGCVYTPQRNNYFNVTDIYL